MADPDGVETKPGAAPPAREAGFSPPDRYHLLERIGEGGMGVVWAAHDRMLDRPVAIKLLHDRYLGAADQARLAAEARAMARLSHPNVVAVYDAGEHAGRMFLTMELVRGIHLARWLEQPRTRQTIVDAFRAAGRGLAAAHAAGIVHRDIKPSNILVGDDGQVRVADFGVAHASLERPDPGAAPSALTAGMIGTPAYMAPEQLRGEPSDARSDQFAFCASLYEALHGTRPFDGETVEALLAAIARGCPPPVKPTPRWLHATIARGLAFAPSDRFPTMAPLLAALDGRRRRRLFVGLGAGALVLAAGGATAYLVAHHAAGRCDLRDALAGTWDAAASARGKAAFASLELGYAPEAWSWLAKQLDTDATRWIDASRAACLERDDARHDCLEAHRTALAALVERTAKPDAALAEDPAAALDALPSVAECAGDSTRSQVHALLAEARRAKDAGDPATLAARASDALRAADAAHIDDASLIPVLFVFTRAALDDGRVGDALTGSKRVVDVTRALGQHHPAYGRAEALAGEYNLKTARLDKAHAKATTALRVAREAYGENHADTADAHALLGAIAAAQGANDTALAELRAALAIRTQLAPESPEVWALRSAIDQVPGSH